MRKSFSGIYALFENSAIVYIGESRDIYRRISEHTFGGRGNNTEKKDFDAWEYIEVEDRFNRRYLESALINYFQPKYNKNESGGYCSHEAAEYVENIANSCEWLSKAIFRCGGPLAKVI